MASTSSHSPLLDKARGLPRTPGVYLMKDRRGRVLYVGKANRLRDRVSSYFQASADLGAWKTKMLGEIDDFDTVDCEGEWEALLTENRLIKDIHPKYNARLTDDKSFPYLVITVKEDFPGVYITREPAADRYRGAKVFGPFTSVQALHESVQLLQKVFRFRTCHLEIDEADERRRHFRPCLLYPIKQCSAPCGARISREAYREDIDRLIRFMSSKRSVMIRELTREMASAAARRDFEKAATLRDQVRAIEKLEERGEKRDRWQPETESPVIDPRKNLESLRRTLGAEEVIRCIDGIDIAHLQGNETVASKVAFVDGRPLKSAYRRYRIRTTENDDYAAIAEVVRRGYRRAGSGQELYPDLVLIDGGKGQLGAALEAFAEFDHAPPRVASLAKKEELVYLADREQPLRLSRHHGGLRLLQAVRDESHRFARHYHHILRRKRTVGE